MTWLMKILGKGNKSKRGFTLIELMVVVIVVGILAAAAVPIYRFAMSRAYASEARATLGTMATSLRVFAAETDPPVYPPALLGQVSTETATTDILSLLGVDTSTNTWWIAGVKDIRGTRATFGTSKKGTWPAASGIAPPTSHTGPYVWALGTVSPIDGIKAVLDMGTGEWYTGF